MPDSLFIFPSSVRDSLICSSWFAQYFKPPVCVILHFVHPCPNSQLHALIGSLQVIRSALAFAPALSPNVIPILFQPIVSRHAPAPICVLPLCRKSVRSRPPYLILVPIRWVLPTHKSIPQFTSRSRIHVKLSSHSFSMA